MKEGLLKISELSVLSINAMALVILLAASVAAFIRTLVALVRGRLTDQRSVLWLRYARWLVAALTFQLAADIIESSVATDWDAIGRLAAVAAIRTFLNYFLERDVDETRAERTESRTNETGAGMTHVAS